jgi:hypothetical protein
MKIQQQVTASRADWFFSPVLYWHRNGIERMFCPPRTLMPAREINCRSAAP